VVTTREPAEVEPARSWRVRMFRPAAEGGLRRRTRDWFGLLLGIVILVVVKPF